MIYPEEFPENRSNEKAEKYVYDILSTLPDEFDTFYNRDFSGRVAGEKIDYEIDFIIADLRGGRFNGIVCIEVKGGIIEYKADGTWFQNKHKLKKSPTKDQVIPGASSLAKRFSDISNKVPFGWMVCFPDVISPGNDKLPPNLNESQIIDRIKLNFPKDVLIGYWDFLHQAKPGKSGTDLLTYNKVFKAPLIRDCNFILPLFARIESDEKTFIRLTAKQAEVLRLLQANDNIQIQGIAGSGKTIIAKEIAQDYFEKGLNVLFLCYNTVLANNIGKYFIKGKSENVPSNLNLDIESFAVEGKWENFDRYPEELKMNTDKNSGQSNRIWVDSYHSFACSVIGKSDPDWWGNQNFRDPDFWNMVVPFKIEEIKKNGEISADFDVLIIDEGQDFMEYWFETVEYFLKPDGKFYVFMDVFQNINQAFMRIPGKRNFTKVPLTENCRNTKNIAVKLTEIIKQDIRSKDGIPDGELVVMVDYKNDTDQQTKILAEIRTLIGEKKVKPEQILILMNTDKSNSCLSQTKFIDKYPLQKLNDRGELSKSAISYTNIMTYKGLEADIVFVIDTDKITYDERVLYTQASRAKHLLYIFMKEGSLYDDRAQKWII